MNLPLFDANAHPTVTGKWGDKNLDSSFEHFNHELASNGYRGACAVGVSGLEGYKHSLFVQYCQKFPHLIPIAGCTVHSEKEMDRELGLIQDLGFKGVKIHPKDPTVNLGDPRLVKFFEIAQKRGLPIFFCTYLHHRISDYPDADPFYALVSLLKRVPQARVLLIHGGDVRLLQYSELVRFNHNLLLDLSQTLMKYPGSSIDLDLQFLFQHFDQRICVGTDFPEYSLHAVKTRFEKLAHGISQEKINNIAFQNIEKFLDLEKLNSQSP